MESAQILSDEIDEAARKAIDALAGYKFAMFGYWAGIWVHLNRIEGKKRPNPFKDLVKATRDYPVDMGGRDGCAARPQAADLSNHDLFHTNQQGD